MRVNKTELHDSRTETQKTPRSQKPFTSKSRFFFPPVALHQPACSVVAPCRQKWPAAPADARTRHLQTQTCTTVQLQQTLQRPLHASCGSRSCSGRPSSKFLHRSLKNFKVSPHPVTARRVLLSQVTARIFHFFTAFLAGNRNFSCRDSL